MPNGGQRPHLVQDVADAEVLAVSIGGLHVPRPGKADHKLNLHQPQRSRPFQTGAPAVAGASFNRQTCRA
jgi:hypothetical protein